MPSVGSTPTTSPATSTINTSQSDQQVNNNNINNINNNSIYTQSYHRNQNSSISSNIFTSSLLNGTTALNDITNNSSTTTSSSSTPIHSPDLQIYSANAIDDNPQDNKSPFNRYSLNSQITHVNTSGTTTISEVTSSLCSGNNNNNNNTTLNRNPFLYSNNIHHQTSYPGSTKFMVITPAVSIDRDFENDVGSLTNKEYKENFNYPIIKQTNLTFSYINNNIIDMANTNINNAIYYHEQQPYQQQQECRSNYVANNFRFKYNSIYNQENQQHQQKSKNDFKKSENYLNGGFTAANAPSSWRWCSFICAAMRCFGGNHHNTGSSNYANTFSTRNYTQVKDDAASFDSGSRNSSNFTCLNNGISGDSNNSIKFNRNLKSFYQNNSTTTTTGPFVTPRKTRDHMNNICYEL